MCMWERPPQSGAARPGRAGDRSLGGGPGRLWWPTRGGAPPATISWTGAGGASNAGSAAGREERRRSNHGPQRHGRSPPICRLARLAPPSRHDRKEPASCPNSPETPASESPVPASAAASGPPPPGTGRKTYAERVAERTARRAAAQATAARVCAQLQEPNMAAVARLVDLFGSAVDRSPGGPGPAARSPPQPPALPAPGPADPQRAAAHSRRGLFSTHAGARHAARAPLAGARPSHPLRQRGMRNAERGMPSHSPQAVTPAASAPPRPLLRRRRL